MIKNVSGGLMKYMFLLVCLMSAQGWAAETKPNPYDSFFCQEKEGTFPEIDTILLDPATDVGAKCQLNVVCAYLGPIGDANRINIDDLKDRPDMTDWFSGTAVCGAKRAGTDERTGYKLYKCPAPEVCKKEGSAFIATPLSYLEQAEIKVRTDEQESVHEVPDPVR